MYLAIMKYMNEYHIIHVTGDYEYNRYLTPQNKLSNYLTESRFYNSIREATRYIKNIDPKLKTIKNPKYFNKGCLFKTNVNIPEVQEQPHVINTINGYVYYTTNITSNVSYGTSA